MCDSKTKRKNCQEKPTITNNCSNNLRRFLLNFWRAFFSGIVKKNRKLSRKSEEMKHLATKIISVRRSVFAKLFFRRLGESACRVQCRSCEETPTPKLGNMVWRTCVHQINRTWLWKQQPKKQRLSQSHPPQKVLLQQIFLLQSDFLLLCFFGILDPVKEPETTQTWTTTGANRDFCETPSGENAEMPSVAVGCG